MKQINRFTSPFLTQPAQFYPDMGAKGSYLLQIDVDTENGGLVSCVCDGGLAAVTFFCTS